MLKKIAAAFFAVLFVATFIPAGALAATDNDPPQLVSVVTDKSSYSSGESIVVTVEATDQSDIMDSVEYRYSFVYIRNVNTSEEQHFFLHTKGTYGELTAAIPVTDNFRTGDYYVSKIDLVDSWGNYSQSPLNLNSAPEFSVSNTVRSDFDAPVLTSLTADKTTAVTGDTITFTATANDATGVRAIGIQLAYETGCFQNDVNLSQVGSSDLWQGTLTIDDTMPSSTYTILDVTVVDTYQDYAYYMANMGGSDPHHFALPDSMRFSIQVTTSHSSDQTPTIASVQLSKDTAKQGDTVKIDVTFNTNGDTLSQSYLLMVYIQNVSGGSDVPVLGLQKVADDKYSCSWPVNVYLHPGDYRIVRYDVTYNDMQTAQFFYNPDQPNDDIFKIIHIGSVFTGIDDVSIPLNSPAFDAMDGVSASNSYGDMTRNIIVTGSVDTSRVGIYLIKYKIKSGQGDGAGTSYYYQAFRWVGVTDVTPDPSSSDLVLTTGNVATGADSGDVAISKGGSDVNYSQTISGEGDYTVSVKDGSGAATTSSKAVFPSEQTNGNSGSCSADFIIDRTGPAVSATWNAASVSDIGVTVACSDPSGIAETKWLPGTKSKSDFKSGGTDFDGSFKADAFGHYTLYARDKLGNETVSTYDIENSDHTGPEISSTYGIVSLNETDVSAVCTDASGVAVMKWCSGSVSLDTIRDQGTVFDQTFIVGIADNYTIYAKDNFGNESIETFSISYTKATGVSLNHSSAKIAAGYSLQLSAKVSPANATFKDVTWSSGNTAVATVDANGLVQAISPGTARITATLADGGKTAVCTVKVVPPVLVKSVHISSTRKSVTIGGSFKLSASVRPNNATVKTIAWSSSDPSVATVDASGRVHAAGVGTATITATANNGKSATCKVTVKPIPVSSVKLDRSKASLSAGASITLTATVRPSNATVQTLAWYSTNTAVATVDGNGNVLAVAKGTCYIYAKASNGKYARCRIKVS